MKLGMAHAKHSDCATLQIKKPAIYVLQKLEITKVG